jgi:hypothetical protein
MGIALLDAAPSYPTLPPKGDRRQDKHPGSLPSPRPSPSGRRGKGRNTDCFWTYPNANAPEGEGSGTLLPILKKAC